MSTATVTSISSSRPAYPRLSRTAWSRTIPACCCKTPLPPGLLPRSRICRRAEKFAQCAQGFFWPLFRYEMPAINRLARGRGDEIAPRLERPKHLADHAAPAPQDQGRAGDFPPRGHVSPIVGEIDGGTGAIVLASCVDAFRCSERSQVLRDCRVADCARFGR